MYYSICWNIIFHGIENLPIALLGATSAFRIGNGPDGDLAKYLLSILYQNQL